MMGTMKYLVFGLLLSISLATYIPVNVMLPLSAISNTNQVEDPSTLFSQLQQLKSVGIDGMMTDVWWGVVEYEPEQYNWTGYETLFNIVQKAGLTMKVIMSFHQCGGNVGDDCNVTLPHWVMHVGRSNPNIFYTDREGDRDYEYLSCGVDNESIFPGPSGNRTAIQIYTDYMTSFENYFSDYLGSVITEVQIGLGPAGEMRYPSYPLDRWTFPGIGEFQCYDSYLLADLKNASIQFGQPLWGLSGPDNAGTYDDMPWQTGFFYNGYQNYASDYGQFFLFWYANRLIQHGAQILEPASQIFKGHHVRLAGKIAGIHWMYKDPSHAAELTAGYKNDLGVGYTPITNMFAQYGVMIDFTCLEMRDSEQPASCLCAPEELVYQTLVSAQSSNISYEGENALPRYDSTAYAEIEYESTRVFPISGFDYLRLDDTLLQSDNLNTFQQFVSTMHTSG